MIRRMLFTLLSVGLAGAIPKEKLLSEDEAKRVVLTMLRSQRTKVARIEAGIDNAGQGPDFYAFRAVGPVNLAGSNTIGGFLVDRATDDVFSADICEEYHTPYLTKLQTAIRKRFRMTDEEYRKLRRPSLLCDLN
jgi:hypothetical protein